MQERNTLQARGFLQIINNQHIQRLVNDSHLDEEAKKRIRSLEYSNYSSFYHIKENSMITMTPAKSLGRSICHADDSTIKWFLMLYSIASVNDIFIEKIHSFITNALKDIGIVVEITYVELQVFRLMTSCLVYRT